MNREIKFRIWNPFLKELSYEESGFLEPMTAGNTGINCIPTQFTGLKDKNGKEVYEGDYLDGYDFPIFYENGCFWISTMPDLYTCPLYEIDFNIAEVVGNKFENPRPDQ